MNYIYISYFQDKLRLSKIIFILSSCLLFLGNSLQAQQEPMYSQYMFNMINLNPAYAGNFGGDNITLLYRMQWVGVDGAPKTGTLSWDRRSVDSNVGYGLQVYNDKLGIETTTGIQAFYSYRLKLAYSTLTFGLSGGALNYQAAYSKAVTSSPDDPLFAQDINIILPTVGFGMLLNADRMYLGFSIPALLKTKVDIDNTLHSTSANNHYFFTGGYIFDVSSEIKLKPSVLLKAVQGSAPAFDFNMNAWFQNSLGFGVSYRPGNAVVGLFEIQLSPTLRLGYAYDYTISSLKTYNVGGSHELMLRYEFNLPKYRPVLSPRYY
ncbi:putative membrane protein [Paludibacter propionicigenes WB4]|uniref:Putative membrane protein n=1 Tax=Paludibacter propionicigenes (strain DSM 17365 / JCM 13257 / WB4) TaxID=694427 RepID=E4T3D9_PALPW|nr:type IX secretion system membrane protein PorP/SprF [Paludibacter propionicigenes]ADQ79233.1 putative membrane protein [Paludibacter propionicigenes WB4]